MRFFNYARLICAFVLLTLWFTALPAWGATPTAIVKNIMDEVMTIQNSSAQEAARAQDIRRIIQKNFDFPAMAKESLGATYNSLSSGQHQEFTQVFSALFQASYTNMVLKFLKRETVKYGKETEEGGRAQVKTTLVRTNDTIPVDYLLHQQGGNWLLYDVIVDGVSILEKYKSGFAREIQARSFQSLLNKMKTQLKAVQ